MRTIAERWKSFPGSDPTGNRTFGRIVRLSRLSKATRQRLHEEGETQ